MTKGWGWVESVTLTSRGDFTAEGWGGGRVSFPLAHLWDLALAPLMFPHPGDYMTKAVSIFLLF